MAQKVRKPRKKLNPNAVVGLDGNSLNISGLNHCCSIQEVGELEPILVSDVQQYARSRKCSYGDALNAMEVVKNAGEVKAARAIAVTNSSDQREVERVLPKLGFHHVASVKNLANEELKIWIKGNGFRKA